MRSKHLFNHDWLFLPEQVGSEVADDSFESVILPHTNKVLPYHNFDDAEYQFVSTYRKWFMLPEPLNGRRLFLEFEGAMLATTVSINDQTFQEHKGGYTPFSVDITDYINESGQNVLNIHLDSTERQDIPPFGHVVDYLAFGGIYRDVYLVYVEPAHITNIFAKPFDVTESPRLEVDVHMIKGDNLRLEVKLSDSNGEGISNQHKMVSDKVVTLRFDDLTGINLWAIDTPVLYHLEVTLLDGDTVLDVQTTRFGFRTCEFRDDGFYLNGKRLQLIGLNRHQTFPYFGAAAPERLQKKDADIIKYELACNIVRTSHYPQSTYFLDRCDEIGLLVFEEIPGWQYIGDAAWQEISKRDVRVMIERDWNHPSIIIWGVRINESLDNTQFYTATNAIAHDLDPTRQTGGVRFWQHSEFLEDVYTFNDFSNSVEEPVQTPHLITEFNGHMFPTKSWDNEERVIEHALRHARIQDRQHGMGGVSGAIGWCAFDYNTHQEFGSGDRICYHGVMDMFRLPKYAAYVYACQVLPKVRPILKVASVWSMGDRSGGGNDPLTILSNCDEIEVFVGNKSLGKSTADREQFPYLPYPPFTVKLELMWGQAFEDLHVVGYVAGEQVIKQQITMDGQPDRLVLVPDDTELNADGMDMTRLVFKIVDRFGNRLPYAIKPVTFELDGPATLFGENPFPLVGGQAAMYIRVGTEAGTLTIRASAPGLDPVEAQINIT